MYLSTACTQVTCPGTWAEPTGLTQWVPEVKLTTRHDIRPQNSATVASMGGSRDTHALPMYSSQQKYTTVFCFKLNPSKEKVALFYWYIQLNIWIAVTKISAFHLFSCFLSFICVLVMFSVAVTKCPHNSNLKEKEVVSDSQLEVWIPHGGKVTVAGAWHIASTVKKQNIVNAVLRSHSPFNSLGSHSREWCHPQWTCLLTWINLVKTIHLSSRWF